MSESPVCRVCLAADVRMLTFAGTPLQLVYEKLTDAELCSGGRPMVACYICHALLCKCLRLMCTAVAADEQLTDIMAKYSKISAESVLLGNSRAVGLCGVLAISSTECTNTPPPIEAVVVKMEEESDDDMKNYDSDSMYADMVAQSDFQGEPLGAAQPCKAEPFKDEETYEVKIKAECSPLVTKPGKRKRTTDTTSDEKHETLSYSPLAGDSQKSFPPSTGLQKQLRTRTVKVEASGSPALVTKHRHRKRTTDITGDEKHETLSDTPRTGDSHKSFPPSAEDIRTHSSEKQLQCNICQKKFTKLSSLLNHSVVHTDEKPFECNVCKNRFKGKPELKKHLLTHTSEKQFQCNIRNRKFSQLANVQRHLKTHTDEKPFECNICKKRLSKLKTLHDHMMVHSDEKPHECNICNRKFSLKNYLQRHLKSHTGEKPFECNICKLKFSLKVNLVRHFKRHTGEKPFECFICERKFPRKHTLRTHLLVHTGEKPFECNICEKKFSQKFDIQRHLKKKHQCSIYL